MTRLQEDVTAVAREEWGHPCIITGPPPRDEVVDVHLDLGDCCTSFRMTDEDRFASGGLKAVFVERWKKAEAELVAMVHKQRALESES